jgi:LPS export ABC transporter protein LptC
MAETIELRGDVEIIRNNSKVLTDWIHYTDKTSEVFTDRPVRIEQEGQFIAAEQGMTYNMRTESIRMRGGVFGSLQSDVIGEASAKPKKGK